VILVRHALPEVVPGVPPRLWELGESGRASARALAQRLTGAQIVSSDEPKAFQTAEAIAAHLGAEMAVDHRLGEVRRPEEWDDAYRDHARSYLAGETLAGWEPREAVVARVTAAARGDIVVTHGLALTLWVAARGLVGERVGFWEELRFPDAWSALAGHLRRVH
jgi:broad specificity phosphatase PhoE